MSTWLARFKLYSARLRVAIKSLKSHLHWVADVLQLDPCISKVYLLLNIVCSHLQILAAACYLLLLLTKKNAVVY